MIPDPGLSRPQSVPPRLLQKSWQRLAPPRWGREGRWEEPGVFSWLCGWREGYLGLTLSGRWAVPPWDLEIHCEAQGRPADQGHTKGRKQEAGLQRGDWKEASRGGVPCGVWDQAERGEEPRTAPLVVPTGAL